MIPIIALIVVAAILAVLFVKSEINAYDRYLDRREREVTEMLSDMEEK